MSRGSLFVLLACLLAGPRALAHGVEGPADWAGIRAVHNADGWSLHGEVRGAVTLVGARLAAPSRAPFALACQPLGPGEVRCLHRDPASGPGFASLAELLEAHPAGGWQLVATIQPLIGAPFDLSGVVPFDPLEPDGAALVTAPSDGAANVSPAPQLSWSNGCSSCNELRFALRGDAGAVSLDATLGAPLPAAGSIDFGAWTSPFGPPPAALADGSYRVVATVGRLEQSDTLLQDAFELFYATGAERSVESTFTVPEPMSSAASLCALLALARLARRRQLGARPRVSTSHARGFVAACGDVVEVAAAVDVRR